MEFYSSIAPWYHHIFPLNPAQVDFVKSLSLETKNQHLLEVGCGTGLLTSALANEFKTVLGIDLDGEMLHIAESETPPKANLSYQKLNMLNLKNACNPVSKEVVICFGNTLVHLDNLDEIISFMHQVYTVLSPGGYFTLQIINYHRIKEKNINYLPNIENDNILFERKYRAANGGNNIKFNTILTVKHEKIRIENNVLLYPINYLQLKASLRKVGFENIQLFGNFQRAPFFPLESVPLIVLCRKP